MHWRIDYWKENLRRSFALWERHQAMSVLVGIGISAILAFVSGWWTGNIWIGLSVLFCFLVFVITPMKMWKEQTDHMKNLTTKRLILSIPEGEPRKDEHGGVWWKIKVENPSSVAIKDCYGKLESFKAESAHTPTARLPYGVRFPWTTHGGTHGIVAPIGPLSSDYLDIVGTRQDNPDYFYTITLSEDSWHRDFLFPLGKGVYTVELAVGSQAEDFPPTKAEFKVIFKGYDKLEIEEFRIID